MGFYTILRTFLSDRSNPLFKIILALYGIPTLDFIRRVLPPFCVGSNLEQIHVAFLGYVSVLYSASLILLTWVAIKLHDRNWRVWRARLRTCRGRADEQ